MYVQKAAEEETVVGSCNLSISISIWSALKKTRQLLIDRGSYFDRNYILKECELNMKMM